MLKYAEDGRSAWFSVDANGLEAAVQATLRVTRQRFANPAAIPFHSRWRHFEAGGRDRWPALAERLSGLPKEEVARRRMDLAVVSVLLDAGAGPTWSYREPGTGETYARSEGLGVASFHMFANGAFSRDAKGDPLRVDAERLGALTPMDIAMGFQVKAHNPLTGLEGRAELLRKLGGVGLSRPGDLFDIVARARGEGGEHPGRRARQAVADLAAAHGRRLAARGHRLGAVPQAVAVAVLFPGRADRRRGAQGHRHSTSSPACPSIATAACWSMPARSGPSRRCCWRKPSPRATSRSSNGAR